MEDPAKIKLILDKLNGKDKLSPWEPVPGYHTHLSIKESSAGQSVNLNQGVTAKLFLNTNTGEIKSYLEDAVIKNG